MCPIFKYGWEKWPNHFQIKTDVKILEDAKENEKKAK